MRGQMTDPRPEITVQPPSKKSLAKATIVALLVAAVLLITAILPAEYGIDPLGTGKALGLTDLHKADFANSTGKAAETPLKSGEAEPTIVPTLEPAADGGAPR